MSRRITPFLVGIVAAMAMATAAQSAEQPNILWLSAEDLSAITVGCYGGQAKTPRLDALAAGGLRFDAAFSDVPVCAPCRSGIITGMMPTTLGSLPMRCKATPPRFVVGFPTFLRDAGYYCTNNSKTDYNVDPRFNAGWNESSHKAHWRNRPRKDQPFFAVFNFMVTHESRLFAQHLESNLKSLSATERTDPASVDVLPFYPDTPVIRQALAHRQDLAAVLDRQVAKLLDELAADGLADSTIVVFWGDHGEGIARGKRALTDYGLRVPLILHVPERFQSGLRLPGDKAPLGVTGNLVSLMDLGPTMLDIAGVAIPEWMEGTSFLGPHAEPRSDVIGVADRMDATPGFGRTVRDSRFRYVRNFLPWTDGDDLPDYANGVPITGELRRVRAAGELPEGATWFARTKRPADELYDVTADPFELRDLSSDPAYAADLGRFRASLRAWMIDTRDTGILPEPILRREARAVGSEWAIFHPGKERDAEAAARYETIFDAAWNVADQPADTPWDEWLESSDPAVRFWTVHGLGWQTAVDGHSSAALSVATLNRVLSDKDPVVRIVAAWWLLKLGADAPNPALDVLRREMTSSDPNVRQQAFVAIDSVGNASRSLWKAAAAIDVGKKHMADEYSGRTIKRIRARLKAMPSE